MYADSNAWYTASGNDIDTIISSRVRIARNILGVPFPASLNKRESRRIYDKMIAAFQETVPSEAFHILDANNLDTIAKKIFEERCIIPADLGTAYAKGFIVRNDGMVSATLNIKDHLRIAAFQAGFDIIRCFSAVKTIADTLATELPFSAVQDIGYLSSDIHAIGSGIKTSVLCSLPGFSLTDSIQNKIQWLTSKNFEVRAYYAQNSKQLLGYLYIVSSKYAAGGTEQSQLDASIEIIRNLLEEERQLRTRLLEEQLWQMQDMLIKAFSLAKNALLLDVREAVDLIFKIKLGINLGFIEGISHEMCTSLLYQTQTAHIAFLLLNGNITFEEHFPPDQLRIERIRALLIQDSLKNAEIQVRKTLRSRPC